MDINYEILQFFARKGIIALNQSDGISAEAERRNIPVERYLVEKGICGEAEALSVMGEFFGMPYIRMDMLETDKELLSKFELSYLKEKKIVPVAVDANGVLVMACARPMDFSAISCAAAAFSGEIQFILVPPAQIDAFLDGAMAVQSTAEALDDINREEDETPPRREIASDEMRLEAADDVINAPAVKLVDSIIKEAIPFRASDIHIEPFEDYVAVRYRIDGRLDEIARFSVESYAAIAARVKIMAGIDIAERRIPQDGHINLTINGSEYDFRVSTLPTVHGEKFAIRILDKSAFSLSRTQLGFTPESNAVVDKMLSRPNGIILMSGPTGCGKSTTLYSFLRELNKTDINIVTVEDPVEYTMPGINQVNVNNKANLTFASALRSIMRQDPDVIMIGEIRDEETAQIAIRAAITGHLVLSTIHTNDAPGVLTRLIDMGVSRYFVVDALIGVISQRLVKKLCPMCKVKDITNINETRMLGLKEPAEIYRPKGCKFCGETGYRGRTAVHEIMYIDDALRNAMSEEISAEKLREAAKRSGMVSLWDNCRNYVLNGITSIQELVAISME